MMRYYKRESTEVLKRLAAQVVAFAGEINPDGIHGLEIIYSDDTRFHPLTEEENNRYKAQAKKTDNQIAGLILGPSAN